VAHFSQISIITYKKSTIRTYGKKVAAGQNVAPVCKEKVLKQKNFRIFVIKTRTNYNIHPINSSQT